MLRDFPGPGCPVLFPLELAVVVWSWSMGLARLGAQGAVGVLSGLVAGGVLVVVVLVVCGEVYSVCICLSGEDRGGGGG